MLEFLLKPSNKVKSIKTALFIHFPLFYVHDGLRYIFLNSTFVYSVSSLKSVG